MIRPLPALFLISRSNALSKYEAWAYLSEAKENIHHRYQHQWSKFSNGRTSSNDFPFWINIKKCRLPHGNQSGQAVVPFQSASLDCSVWHGSHSADWLQTSNIPQSGEWLPHNSKPHAKISVSHSWKQVSSWQGVVNGKIRSHSRLVGRSSPRIKTPEYKTPSITSSHCNLFFNINILSSNQIIQS